MIDIQVSLIELETSFNQVFMFQLLFKKILDALKPVTQIFEHIDSQSTKARPDGDGKYRSEGKSSPKSGILLSMHVNSIYFALIKETHSVMNSASFVGRNSMSYMSGENSCMPMLSLEIKWFELRQKTQITGLQ